MHREFTLPLPSGYRSTEVLSFFSRDTESVSEHVAPDILRKCCLISGSAALLEIRFTSAEAHCSTDVADIDLARHVACRILGLTSEADHFERHFAADPLLGQLIEKQKGLRIPLTPDPWEALAWAIMGQQISLKVAIMLRRNLILAAGQRHQSGLTAHPSAERVASMDAPALRALKFSGSKADYLLAAARAVVSGDLPVNEMHSMSPEHAASLAAAVRGIGPWTIQYFFLRGLGLPDCLPSGDAGLAQGLARLLVQRPGEKQIREIMAPYSPWRSLATYHVWASLKP